MLRFIVRHKHRDAHSGADYDNFVTIDAEVMDLELQLNVGGFGESGFHISELVGVEVLNEETK